MRLSIFGDHSDVMLARSTGFAMLSSASVQEAMDFALIAQAATLESRIPFLHFFDGFRTSHEVSKIELVNEDIIRKMINEDLVIAHRHAGDEPGPAGVARDGAEPGRVLPGARGVQSRSTPKCADITAKAMDQFAAITGRQYQPFQYVGDPNAERVLIIMGSGGETADETVEYLNQRWGEGRAC